MNGPADDQSAGHQHETGEANGVLCDYLWVLLFSRSLTARPALNTTLRFAGTWTFLKVLGFCAALGGVVLTSKTPKSRNSLVSHKA